MSDGPDETRSVALETFSRVLLAQEQPTYQYQLRYAGRTLADPNEIPFRVVDRAVRDWAPRILEAKSEPGASTLRALAEIKDSESATKAKAASHALDGAALVVQAHHAAHWLAQDSPLPIKACEHAAFCLLNLADCFKGAEREAVLEEAVKLVRDMYIPDPASFP